MGVFDRLHQQVDQLRDWPGIRQWRRRSYAHLFATAREAHLFDGVYDSFEAAVAAAPQTAPQGYDNRASSDLYAAEPELVDTDYPALFWLQEALRAGHRRVVDLGGNIGMKFHALRAKTDLPDDLHWTVVDVPEVALRGERLMAEQARWRDARLHFSADLAAIADADVLYASGSLQYLPRPLSEILAGLATRPSRLVINTTPIHPTRGFFTVNNIGTAYCAYRVQARAPFIHSVSQQGYRLRDDWQHAGKGMALPFDEGCSIPSYSGFCFDRAES